MLTLPLKCCTSVCTNTCLSKELQGELFVTVEADSGECAYRTRGNRASDGREENK